MSLGDALRLPKRHPACRRREAQSGSGTERENLAGDGKDLDEEDGPLVFEHACKLGLEGIVSKRRDSVYSSGRSPHWIKVKNKQHPAYSRVRD